LAGQAETASGSQTSMMLSPGVVPPGGKHLLLDLFGCRDGLELAFIEKVLTEAAVATGATVLFSHSHQFDDGGCSGVVLLAESHASFHYWWSERYMAVDVFVCGECDPKLAVSVLQNEFAPQNTIIRLVVRGIG
jgi:S-adenosylmethionine decarboxylase